MDAVSRLIEERARPESLRSALRELSRFYGGLSCVTVMRFADDQLHEIAAEVIGPVSPSELLRLRERERRWLSRALARRVYDTCVLVEPLENSSAGDGGESGAVAIHVTVQDSYALVCHPLAGAPPLPERSIDQLRGFTRLLASVLSVNQAPQEVTEPSRVKVRTVPPSKGAACPLVSASDALRGVLETVDAVANTKATVLIQGESGVGKERIARAIHDRSTRAAVPLVIVNCASVPRELFESEFFGHVRGAFTGAHRDRTGRFELAHRGTLFLDEVGEIPLELQCKLLRVLQEQEFEPVGAHRTQRVDVRVVAATNRDLEDEVRAGRFRQDLYYRLSVFPIRVPPLRERREDIPALARHFLDVHAGALGRAGLAITDEHVAQLLGYDWPGNVRELNNVIERAVIQSVKPPLRVSLTHLARRASQAPRRMSSRPCLTAAQLRARERENIVAALMKSGWRVSGKGGAAELLDMRPSTLRDRLHALGIRRP